MSGARQRPIPYQRLIYQLAPLEHAPLPAMMADRIGENARSSAGARSGKW